jgi:hypothetical protein
MQSRLIPISAAIGALLAAPGGYAQSFGLDDNPRFPMTGPPGFGYGAENPFGVPFPNYPPGWAPSPTLGALPCIDAEILAPGPVLHLPAPFGTYMDALSDHTPDLGAPIRLRFSVDRVTRGVAGTAVDAQAILDQQPGDIFMSTDYFRTPGSFVPTPPGPIGYAGPLPAWQPGPNPMSNTLIYDESMFGLVCAGATVPPGIPAPRIVHGSHDNVDSFDRHILDLDGNQLPDGWIYFTIYPDGAAMSWTSAADIFDVAPNQAGTGPLPYATATSMGLDRYVPDSIDALVVYDFGAKGGPAWGGPGGEPGHDYALFSLAPGSGALMMYGLNAADVFLTDFQGNFYLYADATEIGLLPFPGGEPLEEVDNVDSLDAVFAPCPWDCGDNDGVVGINDFLALLAQWGNPGPCDFDGDSVVGINDFLTILGSWGPCP